MILTQIVLIWLTIKHQAPWYITVLPFINLGLSWILQVLKGITKAEKEL